MSKSIEDSRFEIFLARVFSESSELDVGPSAVPVGPSFAWSLFLLVAFVTYSILVGGRVRYSCRMSYVVSNLITMDLDFVLDCPEQSEENAMKSTSDKYSAYSTNSTERGEIKRIESNPSRSINKYLKEVTINGVTLKSFIDPGSSECTIKASIALLNDLAIEKNRMNLHSFGPSEYTVHLQDL